MTLTEHSLLCPAQTAAAIISSSLPKSFVLQWAAKQAFKLKLSQIDSSLALLQPSYTPPPLLAATLLHLLPAPTVPCCVAPHCAAASQSSQPTQKMLKSFTHCARCCRISRSKLQLEYSYVHTHTHTQRETHVRYIDSVVEMPQESIDR